MADGEENLCFEFKRIAAVKTSVRLNGSEFRKHPRVRFLLLHDLTPKSAHQKLWACNASDSAALSARWCCRLRACATSPYRSRTARTMLLAGTRTSQASSRTKSSRTLRETQCGFSLSCISRSSPPPDRQADWRREPAQWPIRQGFKTPVLEAIEDRVVRLASYPEIPADITHS